MKFKIITTTFFFLLFFQTAFSQNEQPSNQMVVIAANGLNFRAEPYTRAKVIGKIDYGAKVLALEHLTNTIFTLNHQYEATDFQGLKNVIEVSGYWVKVKYKAQIGYLFSGYLCFTNEMNQWLATDLNQDFLLLFEDGACFNNIPKTNDWKWYGMFQEKERFYFKKISPSFYKTLPDNLMGDPYYKIFSNESNYCLFMVGSKKELPERKHISKTDFHHYLTDESNFNREEFEKEIAHFGIIRTVDKEHKNQFIYQIEDNQGKKYPLNVEEVKRNFLNTIIWKGDIDGDRIDDYIIHFGEKSGKTILFLSTPTGKEELVKPVAVYLSGYCC